ncbi:MAG: 2-oxoacid:acceptor oxidoreductase subunit alpha, partial [Candidatus Acidiferrales bacterium]
DLYHEWPAHAGHIHEVAEGGGLLFEESAQISPPAILERLNGRRVELYPMPYSKIVDQALATVGKAGQAHEYRIMNNTAAIGAATALMGFDFERVAAVILAGFHGKARKVGEMNVYCARAAHDYVREHFKTKLEFSLPAAPARAAEQIMIKGTQAVGIAKLKAGCGVQTYYPISPATDESVYLEEHQTEYQLIVLQTEDEVSAVDAAVMAAHGGARASTSTSGPGFALMPEGVGFAAITEAPGPVICLYQRGGPSTGLPTRHEQGDLRFALHAGQGDIPRLVLAPGDMNECFYDTFDAFNYADRYQMPVILLLDKHLATQYVTLPPYEMSGLTIDRGEIFDPEKDSNGQYRRYRFTESGISPRAIPGQPGGAFWTTTDEHDQVGHITEGIGNRLVMMDKRMGKLALAAREIPEEKKFRLVGRPTAPVTVVSWGSTKGAILDALARLDPEQQNYNFLQIRLLLPFPAEAVEAVLKQAAKVVVFECNYSGQLASLLREKTGVEAHHRVLKHDGRPFSEDEVVAALEAATANGRETLVVSEGRVVEESYGREQVEKLVELRERSGKMAPPMVPLPPGYNR